MTITPILRLTVGAALYAALEPYRITDEALMPEEYRTGRRPLHDDWALLKDTPRIVCARRVPLPFKVTSGDFRREWLLFDPSYPMSPGMETKIENGLTYVLTDRGGYGLVVYSAFIGGEWRPVFRKYTRAFNVLGTRKRLSWYVGLHQDNHVSPPDAAGKIRSDLMGWIEPFAMSFVKEI